MNPSNKKPLSLYVAGVIIVMAIVIGIRYLLHGTPSAETVSIFCAGFLLGMFAMYIAMHIYRHK